jgi:hypothetical protein
MQNAHEPFGTLEFAKREVRLRNGRIVREGLRTTLTELRQRRTARTARQRWDSICGFPANRSRAK